MYHHFNKIVYLKNKLNVMTGQYTLNDVGTVQTIDAIGPDYSALAASNRTVTLHVQVCKIFHRICHSLDQLIGVAFFVEIEMFVSWTKS